MCHCQLYSWFFNSSLSGRYLPHCFAACSRMIIMSCTYDYNSRAIVILGLVLQLLTFFIANFFEFSNIIICFIITFLERTGIAKSPCDDDSQCNAGLFCSYNVFDGGKCEKLRKEGESCTMGMFDRRRPRCVEGLSCKRTR